MRRPRLTVLVAVLFVFLAGLSVPARADYREDFHKTLPLKAGDRFALENVNGGVAVTTWKEDKVEIKAVKKARRKEKDLGEVEIQVEQGDGSVRVKAVWPKFPRRVNVSVEFEVKVPEGVHLEDVETVNGGITLSGGYGRIDAGTTNGSISVENASGDIKAATTNGEVRINGFDGRVQADTTNGDIRLEGLTFKNGVEAETTNGSITLAIISPETLNADLRAGTTNGRVSVDFPVTLQNLSRSRRRIDGRIGQGGPAISLHTTNGSITLTR
ncbi:MAG: DUF4097 family beta strand repeat-containing protein [Acidobacteriota bacterium]|nr:DUF4097 family beta strand repeat-containing protein [Acidobacteriota bacterium]